MRRSNWLGFVTVLAGGVITAASLAVGCGGKTDEPGETTPADTGVGIVESGPDTSAPKDTGSVEVDSGSSGSIYDAVIPDIAFGDGKTSGGCVACAGKECKKELDACDADPKCRGLFLCVLTECAGSFTDYSCAIGCGIKFGVTSLSDPVLGLAQDVGVCLNSKCSADCPSAPSGGDGGTADAPKSDAATSDASETGAYMIFPAAEKHLRSIDPRVLDVLSSAVPTSAEARAALVERFSH